MSLAELYERAWAAWQILRHGLRRPPPPKAAPAEAPPAPAGWQRISAEELDHVRGIAASEHWSSVNLCRGPSKGCHKWPLKRACPECYRIPWHEQRPSAELIAAMERGDA